MEPKVEKPAVRSEHREYPAALTRYDESVDLWGKFDRGGITTVDELLRLSRLGTPDQACREAMAALDRDRAQELAGQPLA